eukprot:gb/GECG01001516.1/.p1 GENE.gb/GECG01001516.1/~~gb/GECG01001516.1/.p1  ORF type:complete len:288 (+),score=33.60 gb/GECG01001516.1/:1-864(+)
MPTKKTHSPKKGSSDMEATLQLHVKNQQDEWERQLQKKVTEAIYSTDFFVAYRLFIKAIHRVCCSPSLSQEKLQPYQQALGLMKGSYVAGNKTLLKSFKLLGERRFKNLLGAAVALKREAMMRKSHGHMAEGTNNVAGHKRGRDQFNGSTTTSSAMCSNGREFRAKQSGRHFTVSEESIGNQCSNIARSAFRAGYQHAMRRIQQEMIRSAEGKHYLLDRSLERVRSSMNPSDDLIEHYKMRSSIIFEDTRKNTGMGDQTAMRIEADHSSRPFSHQFHDLGLRFGVQF